MSRGARSRTEHAEVARAGGPPGASDRAWGACLLLQAIAITAWIVGAAQPSLTSWAPALLAALPTSLAAGLLAISVITGGLLGSGMALGRPASPRSSTLGTIAVPILLGVVLVTLTTTLPDRSAFWGDSIVRAWAAEFGDYRAMFPQGMPLDGWVFGDGPRAIAQATGGSHATARLALAVALHVLLLAAVAWCLAPAPADRPDATLLLVVGLLVPSSMVFSGMNRDTVLLLPATAVYLGAHRRLRSHPTERRWAFVLLAALLVCVLTHRSAVLLLPHAAVRFWPRAGLPRATRSAIPFLLFIAIAIAAILLVLRVLTQFDATHHMSWLRHPLAWPILRPPHWVDLGNALLLLGPALILLPAALSVARRRSDLLALVSAGIPAAAFAAIPPQQGLPRDLDVHAWAALILSVSVLTSLEGVRVLRHGILPRLTFAAVTTLSLLSLLLLKVVPARHSTMLAYVARLVTAPAAAGDARVPQLAAFSGLLESRRGHALEAARSFAIASHAQPTAHYLGMTGVMWLQAARPDSAATAFASMLEADPRSMVAWLGTRASARARGDSVMAHEALSEVLGLAEDPAMRSQFDRALRDFPTLLDAELLAARQALR